MVLYTQDPTVKSFQWKIDNFLALEFTVNSQSLQNGLAHAVGVSCSGLYEERQVKARIWDEYHS